jgi:integrase
MVRRGSQKAQGPTARLITYKNNRSIGIRWKCGNRFGEISSETTDRDDAVGQKALLLDRLNRGIFPRKDDGGPSITWAAFKARYENEHLSDMSEGSQSAWTTTANWVDKLLKPKLLIELIDKGAISKFRGKLIDEGLSPNSIATYLRTLGASLGWAHDEIEGIPKPPRIRARKGIKRHRGMRSRPITGEEFDRILEAIPEVRSGPRMNDAPLWVRFIRGLSLSSLRIDELRRLSWDEMSDLCIDTNGTYPMIRMLAGGHKSREDCYQPMTPAFWELISATGNQRTGYVFPLNGVRGRQMTNKRVIRIVGQFGAHAGVITNTSTKKTATSHDIGRRAELTRLAATGMSMSQVQQWARHSDPKTTSEFYIRHTAEKLAEAAGWSCTRGAKAHLPTQKRTPHPSG